LKKCDRCGTENLDFAKFCDNCGSPLAESPAPAPGAPAAGRQAGARDDVEGAVLRSEITGKEFLLEAGKESMIGRGDPAKGVRPEVTLDDDASLPKGVSRLHAKIICGQDNYYVVDLNSTNATYVNGTRLIPQQAYSLADGDIIELGNYKTTFSIL
jgi:hypothetical protein